MKTFAFFQLRGAFVAVLLLGAVTTALAGYNVTISNGAQTGGSFSGGTWTPTSSPSVINVTTLIAQLNSNPVVTINTIGVGAEEGNITIGALVPLDDLTTLGHRSLIFNALNDLLINAPLSQYAPGGDNAPNAVEIFCHANSDALGGGVTTMSADVNTAGGSFTVTGNAFTQTGITNLDTSGGALDVSVKGAVNFTGNSVTTSGGTVYFSAMATSTLSASITTSGATVRGEVNGAGNNLNVSSGVNAVGGAGTGLVDLHCNGGTLQLNVAALLSCGPSGAVVLRAATGMTLDGDVSSGGGVVDIDVTSAGNLTANSTALISALGGGNTGSIDVDVINGTITWNSGSQFRSGTVGSVTASNQSPLNDFTAAGTVVGGSGGVILTSLRQLTHSGSTTSSGTLELGADVNDFNGVGNLSVGGTVSSAGTMTLRGANVDVVSSAVVDSNGGSLNIIGRNDCDISGDLVSDGNKIQITAGNGGGGTLTVKAPGLLDARLGVGAGGVILRNNAGSIVNAGEVRSGPIGLVLVEAVGAGSSITQGGIMVAGAEPVYGLTLYAANGITINAETIGDGLVTMEADHDFSGPGTLQIQAGVLAVGPMMLQGVDVVSTAAGSLGNVGQPIDVKTSGLIDLAGPINSKGGSVTLTAGATLDLSGGTLSSDGGAVTLRSTGAMTLDGAITTGGGRIDADVTASGALNINNDIITGGGVVEITTVGGPLQTAVGADVDASGGAGSASVRLEAFAPFPPSGSLTTNGAVKGGGGGTQLRAGGDLTVNGPVTGNGGAVTLRANSEGGPSGNLSVNAPVSLSGMGGLTLGGVDFSQAGTGTLHTGVGSITGTFTGTATVSRSIGGGGITFSAVNVVGDAGATWTSLISQIQITSTTGTLNLQGPLDSNGGTIRLTAGSTLTTGAGGVSSDGGPVELFATTGMYLGGMVTTAGGTFTADVTGPGPMQISADVITLGGKATATTANGLLSTAVGADILASGAGTGGVRLESLAGPQDLLVGGSILSGVGGLQLRAGNHVTVSGQVTASGGGLILMADTNLSGGGNLVLNAPLMAAGSGYIDLKGKGMTQGSGGTVTASGGTITGEFGLPVTVGAGFSSNGGKVSITSTSGLTVDALVSSAPPVGGSGVLHVSSGVVQNVPPVVGNADVILIGTTVAAPSITGATASGVTTVSAALGGNVTNGGGMTITERGVVFSPTAQNSNPVIGGPNVTQLTTTGTTGVFSVTATDLTLGTGYSFKAYATNVIGTTYTSPVASFTTSTTTAGQVDEGFVTGTITGTVLTMATQPDGKVIIGGVFSNVGTHTCQNIARLNADGSYDSSFSAQVNAGVTAIIVQPDGRILIGGVFTEVNDTAQRSIARLKADGLLDSSFDAGPGMDGVVIAMALQPDGKIVIGGVFQHVGWLYFPNVARLAADGSVDAAPNFDTGDGPDGPVHSVALQPDGKIVIGGDFNMVNGEPRQRIARLEPDGQVEMPPGYNLGSIAADAAVYAVAVQGDGKILLGGDFFDFANGEAGPILARLFPDGSVESFPSFPAFANATVVNLIIQTDGRILAAGHFSSLSGQPRNAIGRLINGGPAESTSTFNVGSGLDGGYANGLMLQEDGRIIVAGAFSSINGLPRSGLARMQNGPATRVLSVVDATTVRWMRSGTAPEPSVVLFSASVDGGSTWSPLGTGSRISGGWELAGITLPASGTLRAQGLIPGGHYNGSSGLAEQTTTIALPRMEVRGNGVLISSGDTTPDAADLTLFTTTNTPGLAYDEHTFVIENTGASTLNLPTAPQVTGGGGDFRITRAPAATVPPGGSTSFTLRFNPSLPGAHTASITLASNDPLGNPHTFTIAGSGDVPAPLTQKITFLAPPKLYVGQGAVPLQAYSSSGLPVTLNIVSGGTFASLAGDVITPVAPGTVKVAATQAGELPYKAATPVVRTIVIAATPTAPTLTNLLQFYDGGTHPVGVIGNMGAPVITYGGSPTAPKNAGSYAVVAVVDGRTLRGTLTLLKAPLMVQPGSHRRFITQSNPVLTLNYDGFVGMGDDEASVLDAPGARRPAVTTTAKPTSPGGLYPITASGGFAWNYTLIYLRGHLMVESFAGGYEALLEDTLSGLPVGKLEITVAGNSTQLSGQLNYQGETATLRFTGTLALDLPNETATGTITPIVKGINSYSLNLVLPFGSEWSGGSQLWWTGGKPDQKLTLALPVAKAGKYTLTAALTKARDYGVVSITLDGKPVASTFDGYNSPQVIHTGELDWGTHDLTAGEHQLSFTLAPPNPDALSSNMVGLDYVKLTPVK